MSSTAMAFLISTRQKSVARTIHVSQHADKHYTVISKVNASQESLRNVMDVFGITST